MSPFKCLGERGQKGMKPLLVIRHFLFFLYYLFLIQGGGGDELLLSFWCKISKASVLRLVEGITLEGPWLTY